MATKNLSLLSERWNDIVILQGTSSNVDGDQSDDWLPPVGLGDIAIMEILVDVGQIATILASSELYGPRVSIVSPASSALVDFVSAARWTRIEADALTAWLSPDPLVLCRQGELIRIRFEEPDTNASPTADVTVNVKAVRVRQPEPDRGIEPLRFVR